MAGVEASRGAATAGFTLSVNDLNIKGGRFNAHIMVQVTGKGMRAKEKRF